MEDNGEHKPEQMPEKEKPDGCRSGLNYACGHPMTSRSYPLGAISSGVFCPECDRKAVAIKHEHRWQAWRISIPDLAPEQATEYKFCECGAIQGNQRGKDSWIASAEEAERATRSDVCLELAGMPPRPFYLAVQGKE